MENTKLKTIDLTKHTDITKSWSWSKNQEDQIKSILIREFYHNRENKINDKPKININELNILGYKKPEKAVKTLIQKGIVKQLDDNIIELVTKQVYCSSCDYNKEVFIWDKQNHLKTFHSWDETTFKHNVAELKFSNKPLPDKIDHDFQRIGEIEDNQINIKCKNCGYERTIYIDYYRNECNPFDKSIFIENPEDNWNIKVKTYSNHETITLENQEELKKFIATKIKENEQ